MEWTMGRPMDSCQVMLWLTSSTSKTIQHIDDKPSAGPIAKHAERNKNI